MTQTSHQAQAKEGNTIKPKRGRFWAFTWNNYTLKDYNSITHWLKKYCNDYRCGKEIGESGTPHLQGYMSFKHQRTFDSLHNQWPKMHIEFCKGSKKDNIMYCTKDGDSIRPFDADTDNFTDSKWGWVYSVPHHYTLTLKNKLSELNNELIAISNCMNDHDWEHTTLLSSKRNNIQREYNSICEVIDELEKNGLKPNSYP